MVTDERGDKMSKVKGNVVDPLDVIHGATLDVLLKKAEQGGANLRILQSFHEPAQRAPFFSGAPGIARAFLRVVLLHFLDHKPARAGFDHRCKSGQVAAAEPRDLRGDLGLQAGHRQDVLAREQSHRARRLVA